MKMSSCRSFSGTATIRKQQKLDQFDLEMAVKTLGAWIAGEWMFPHVPPSLVMGDPSPSAMASKASKARCAGRTWQPQQW